MRGGILERTLGDITLNGERSDSSFSRIIMPGNAIFRQKDKETVSIADKPFLVGEHQIGGVAFASDDLVIKSLYLLLKWMEMSAL